MPERAFLKGEKMGIKENLEQRRIELAQEREELEKHNKESEKHKIETYKNKALLLHKKSLKLIEPYESLINYSGCIPAIENLVQIEKITLNEEGVWPQDAAHARVTFGVGHDQGDNKIKFLNCYYGLEKSGGFLKLTEAKDTDILKIREDSASDNLIRINEDSLSIYDCRVYLIWDKYSEIEDYEYFDRTWHRKHTHYKSIEVNFNYSSINIFGNKEELAISKENINKNIIEKAICRVYLNPSINDYSGLDYT